MEPNWAAEHLQVIRTLMERSALYRRALAPIMIFNGVLGVTAAAMGWGLGVAALRAFILFWAGVGVIAVAGSFFLVRRQALKEFEPFWSPPTRRVTQAFLPPLAAGLLISTAVLLKASPAPQVQGRMPELIGLPLLWVVLYGCAFHGAGFFMQRGMKIFGWVFVIGGCSLFALGVPDGISAFGYAHAIMGFFFGGLHLASGVYLYFTERNRNET